MNRKVSFKETPQADLTEMKSYTPSPLKMDDETWSIGSDIDNPQPIQFLESSDTAISSEMQYQKTSLSESKTDTLYLEKDEDEGDIDDDKDQDFDWNDNPDAEKTMNSLSRRTTVKRIKTAYHKYFCWHYLSNFMKCLVIALVGSSIFITIGVCVYIYFPRPTAAELADPSFTNVRANLQVWMYWAAFMWHLAWLTTFIIEALPYIVIQWVNVFIGHRSEKVKTYLEVTIIENYLLVSHTLTCFCMSSSIIGILKSIQDWPLYLLSIGEHGLSSWILFSR
jgi:hypothetical protein